MVKSVLICWTLNDMWFRILWSVPVREMCIECSAGGHVWAFGNLSKWRWNSMRDSFLANFGAICKSLGEVSQGSKLAVCYCASLPFSNRSGCCFGLFEHVRLCSTASHACLLCSSQVFHSVVLTYAWLWAWFWAIVVALPLLKEDVCFLCQCTELLHHLRFFYFFHVWHPRNIQRQSSSEAGLRLDMTPKKSTA